MSDVPNVFEQNRRLEKVLNANPAIHTKWALLTGFTFFRDLHSFMLLDHGDGWYRFPLRCMDDAIVSTRELNDLERDALNGLLDDEDDGPRCVMLIQARPGRVTIADTGLVRRIEAGRPGAMRALLRFMRRFKQFPKYDHVYYGFAAPPNEDPLVRSLRTFARRFEMGLLGPTGDENWAKGLAAAQRAGYAERRKLRTKGVTDGRTERIDGENEKGVARDEPTP